MLDGTAPTKEICGLPIVANPGKLTPAPPEVSADVYVMVNGVAATTVAYPHAYKHPDG